MLLQQLAKQGAGIQGGACAPRGPHQRLLGTVFEDQKLEKTLSTVTDQDALAPGPA